LTMDEVEAHEITKLDERITCSVPWRQLHPQQEEVDSKASKEEERQSLELIRKHDPKLADHIESEHLEHGWVRPHVGHHMIDEEVRKAVEENKDLRQQLAAVTNQLEDVQGALADAGTVLAVRKDGNLGESVRELTRERDEAREQLAAARARCEEL